MKNSTESVVSSWWEERKLVLRWVSASAKFSFIFTIIKRYQRHFSFAWEAFDNNLTFATKKRANKTRHQKKKLSAEKFSVSSSWSLPFGTFSSPLVTSFFFALTPRRHTNNSRQQMSGAIYHAVCGCRFNIRLNFTTSLIFAAPRAFTSGSGGEKGFEMNFSNRKTFCSSSCLSRLYYAEQSYSRNSRRIHVQLCFWQWFRRGDLKNLRFTTARQINWIILSRFLLYLKLIPASAEDSIGWKNEGASRTALQS